MTEPSRIDAGVSGPVRSGRSRPGGRSARVRAQVIEATLRLLVEKGYSGLRFEDVAAASGVHKTSIYRRWGTRSELVIDVVQSFAEKSIPIADTGNLRDDLVELVNAVASALQSLEGRALVRTIMAAGSDSFDLAEFGRKVWAARTKAADALIRSAVERGELPEVDTYELLEALCAPAHMRIFLWGRPFRRRDAERHVDLILAGIEATAGQTRRSPK